MTPGKKAISVIGLLLITSIGSTQEKDVAALLKKLEDRSYAVRMKASEDLAEVGAPAVDKLFETIVDANAQREARRLCVSTLLKMKSKGDKKINAVLVEKTRKYEIKKFPHAKRELKLLRAEVLGEVHLSENDAIQVLSSFGCRIVKGVRRPYLIVVADHFRGKPKDFKAIIAIKTPIQLQIKLRKQHALFSFLPKINNLESIQFTDRDRFKGRPIDRALHAKLVKAMDQVFKCSTLKEFDFGFTSMDDSLVHSLDKLTELERVTLGAKVTDKTLGQLGKMKKLKTIRFVNTNKITGSGFSKFEENKLITSLSFYSSGMETENLKYLKKFPMLTHLTMQQNSDNDDVRTICELPEIVSLSIGNTYVNDHVFQYLKKMKKLKRLSISESPLTDRSVPKINGLENLERFSTSQTFITEKGFKEIEHDKHEISQSFGYFKPDSPEALKAIHQLIDQNVAIRISFRKKICLSLRRKDKEDLSGIDLSRLKFETLHVRNEITPENLKAVMKLNTYITVYVTGKSVSDETVKQLESHFGAVRDVRKKE